MGTYNYSRYTHKMNLDRVIELYSRSDPPSPAYCESPGIILPINVLYSPGHVEVVGFFGIWRYGWG